MKLWRAIRSLSEARNEGWNVTFVRKISKISTFVMQSFCDALSQAWARSENVRELGYVLLINARLQHQSNARGI